MKIIDKFIGYIAPHYCVCCSAEGTVLCGSCYQSEVLRQVSACFVCRKATFDFDVCNSCTKKTPIKRMYIATYLDSNVQKLIYMFKFGRTYAVAQRIAEILDDTCLHLPENTVITYVPSSPKRIRARGYDHTRLIAKNFAKLRKLKYQSLLVKTNSSRQVGADKKTRFVQANRSYKFSGRTITKTNKIVLIDDIATTGATLGACTSLLKKAGFKDVDCLVFATKD